MVVEDIVVELGSMLVVLPTIEPESLTEEFIDLALDEALEYMLDVLAFNIPEGFSRKLLLDLGANVSLDRSVMI